MTLTKPILDQVRQRSFRFAPRTVSEYIALQLARAMDDVANIRNYVCEVDENLDRAIEKYVTAEHH